MRNCKILCFHSGRCVLVIKDSSGCVWPGPWGEGGRGHNKKRPVRRVHRARPPARTRGAARGNRGGLPGASLSVGTHCARLVWLVRRGGGSQQEVIDEKEKNDLEDRGVLIVPNWRQSLCVHVYMILDGHEVKHLTTQQRISLSQDIEHRFRLRWTSM